MSGRVDPFEVAPETMAALYPLEAELLDADLDRNLAELVRLRVSQLNACAYSIHLHTIVALLRGETPARLHALQYWEQSALFTPSERAALTWTDAVTALDRGHVPDAVYEEAARHFSAFELSALTLLVVVINAWNRVALGLRLEHPMRFGEYLCDTCLGQEIEHVCRQHAIDGPIGQRNKGVAGGLCHDRPWPERGKTLFGQSDHRVAQLDTGVGCLTREIVG